MTELSESNFRQVQHTTLELNDVEYGGLAINN